MIINNPIYPVGVTGSDGNVWRLKVLEIGAWNMDTTATQQVAHGLGSNSWKDIAILDVIIMDDDDTTRWNSGRYQNSADPSLMSVGVNYVDDTNIVLQRRTGGGFDSVWFDDAVMNRGYIIILYHE